MRSPNLNQLQINLLCDIGSKMAKSEGNFLRLQALLDKHIDPLAYRYWLLMAHYSTPMVFSFEAVKAAQNALERLRKQFSGYPKKTGKVSEDYVKKFKDFIENNLDTPRVIALIWELVKDEKVSIDVKKSTLLEFDKVLGLKIDVPVADISAKNIPQEVQKLVEERENTRKSQDWQKADNLRQQIAESGYEVKDTDSGPEISLKS